MRRNARCPRPEVLAPRRGNSIVLVMGILVLLVIIATAFITRTHAGRVTANVMVRTTLRDDNARVIAEMIADEIGEALFPRPIDPADPALPGVGDSNFPRLTPLRNPVRYGVDQDNDGPDGIPFSGDDDGFPDYPYNFAPYHVVPSTNWPDGPPGGPPDLLWPDGPGNDGGGTGSANLDAEGNPVGNPGFSDARWLADVEPLRWDTDLPPDGIVDAFSHWRHMTNIARPNNGFRICKDISDITNLLGFGGIVEDLSIPVEQWLAIPPANLAPVTGDSSLAVLGPDLFLDQWQAWFGPDYQLAYINPALLAPGIPANFYRLSDLDPGFTPPHEWFINNVPQERPESEFIPGTARHTVNRVLVDTDGDGFTDSFWYLAPTMTERGIRQVVAVRIVDNSAMLNANVATRFLRNDIDYPAGSKTTGATPADLALVGELADDVPPDGVDPTTTWNVGFYDNPAHDNSPPFAGSYEFDYFAADVNGNPIRWPRHLTEVGLVDSFGNPILEPDAATRLEYWQSAGRVPFSATSGLTPFTLADELELRMFHGQNYPWIFSRYEYSVQQQAALTKERFLRANLTREESSEYLDQLSNRMLVADKRRMLTLFNGARNEEMPPWLWWRWDIPQDIQDDADNNPGDNDGNGVPDVIDRFLAQARTKVDLRQPELGFGPVLPPGVRNFRQRLAPTLLLALIDGDGNLGTSYFGEYSTADQINLDRARLAAAGLAANIREWRDDDSDLDLDDAEPLPELNAFGPVGDDLRMLGMERQPFLLEAFIGQVYHSQGQIVCLGVPGEGENYVTSDAESTPIVVVQIANPYGTPIDDMSQFAIRVFGQTFPLNGTLGPSTEQEPRTAIVYSIPQAFAGDLNFGINWLDFLDLESDDLQAGTVLFNATNVWTDDVADFASSSDEAVELLRDVDGVPIVIDRIDDPDGLPSNSFRSQVLALNAFPYRPPGAAFECDLPIDDNFFNGIRIGNDDYFVVWARAGRVWGYDWDPASLGAMAANERAPRYIFSIKSAPWISDTESFDGQDGPGPVLTYKGDSYEQGQDPDSSPWMTHVYTDPMGGGGTRKPTFLTLAVDYTGGNEYGPFNKIYNGIPDNGVGPENDYFYQASLQMLQKDADFEQVGELLNVWMFGHELKFDGSGAYDVTTQTFSEFMIDDDLTTTTDEDPLVNRLRMEPASVVATLGQVVGKPLTPDTDPMYLLDFQHAVPTIPAAARVLDAFVCDDRGVVLGATDEDAFRNANGFTGKITPGLININTAPPEVLRSAPHMARLVHEIESPSLNPFVRVPEAIMRYRERFGDPADLILPAYGDRGAPNFLNNPDLDDLRGDRGFASLGEMMLLLKPLTLPDPNENENWRIDFAGLRPPAFLPPGGVESTQISTDVNDIFIDQNGDGIPQDDEFFPDEVAKDAEELNLLFAGMSNMLTTRSDVFTVYFRVRSFIQNPTTRVWDATNPEFIVDDSRYVMLVDRSEVNHPNDKPKILYLEKLPK